MSTTTDIYRIKTRNSVYEIIVHDPRDGNRPSQCRKEGSVDWHLVSDPSGAYLDKLCIGPGFDVPGVVNTSNVEDYVHLVVSTEPKRKAKALKGSGTGIPEFFEQLAHEVVQQARPAPGEVTPDICGIGGCTVKRVPGLPNHDGARLCKSGSIASGGTRAHCSCDYCY